MRRFLVVLVTGGLAAAAADPIPISPSQFHGKDFVKAFIGSYGFLSPVEPKVDAEEAALLAELGEMFGRGRFKEAESQLVNFIRLRDRPVDPTQEAKGVSAAMIFVLGNLYFQNDRVRDAERSYQLAIKRFPKFRRAFKNLALLYASAGDMEKALPNLKQAIQLGDGDHRSFGLLGYAYLLDKKPVAAEGGYRQAYLLNPDEKDWKMGLAQALIMQEKWPESAALLGELIDETPDSKQLWLQQANAYLGMDQKMRAAANFEILRRKGLADVATLDLLGNIYMDQGQPMLALGAYLAAMRKGEGLNIRRSLETARVLVDYGATEEALEYVVAVRDQAAGQLTTADQVALLLVEMDAAKVNQDEEKVGALLDQVLEIEPGNGKALVERGLYLEGRADLVDDPDEREALLAKARTSLRLALEKPDVAYEANLRYGQMQVRQRQFIEGVNYLKVALELKESDNLQQYVRRVERAAERQKVREEREKTERAEAEARAREEATSKEADE